MVRWLDDDEQRTWRAFLWATQLLQEEMDRQLQRDAGVPLSYYVAMAMLSESPTRSLTMSELAQSAHSSPSRLSHAVRKLEELGYIERSRHPEDGRTTIATLTEAGLAFVESAAPGHVETVRRAVFDPLGHDQAKHLREISEAILQQLGRPCEPGPAPAPEAGTGTGPTA
ncbi:MarR family winged helix-turn-helix transcriptional regulator [Actinocorallia longicatena]